jgi:pSer/pThr/pTyr-binding forkhead associated (FHA) protein
MTDQNPNEEPKQEQPLEEALPTQMMPDGADMEEVGTPTSELRLISFYLPSRHDPLVSRETTITMGRRDPKRKINPTIDLTEERGAQLGVSRLHAEINYQKGRYYLKDMGSSNGTWVNNSKLVPYQPHPIDTGDQIRLGQLAILVHITMPQRARSTSHKLVDTITDTDYTFRLTTQTSKSLVQAQGGFAPTLLEAINVVLQSIEKIYYIMREAQQAEAEGFSIIRIRTEPMDGAILVDVKGGADVLGFLTTKMPDFVKVLSGGEAVSLSSEMEEALEIAHIDQYESSAEQVSEYALQELVFRFMGDERRHYVKQLAPHFSELISSTLDVVTAE